MIFLCPCEFNFLVNCETIDKWVDVVLIVGIGHLNL